MAKCLEFDQIISRVGRFTPSVPSSGAIYRSRILLYTVPNGHVAKIDQAENLGSGLMYGVTSGAGTFTGLIALTGGTSGESLPSRHRNLSGSWMAEGDKLYAYDMYDMQNTSAASHPDGVYVQILEYDVVTSC
tara:strand:+ start:163 stop:561 length:399 start_codon:yes stop_codon:yes gene_type:complete